MGKAERPLTNRFAERKTGIIVAAARIVHNFPHDWGHRTNRQMRTVSLFELALVVCAVAFAWAGSPANGTSFAAAQAAGNSLPHDRHDGLSVSVDSYPDAARAKAKFGKANPIPVGILPVEVFLSNETNQPIHIDLSTIQLEVHPPDSRRQDIDSLTVAAVADAVAHPDGPRAPQERRFPIGIPMPGKDKKAERVADLLRPLSLDADIVPPMGSIHGFLFFDLSHDMSLAETASLYLPDAKIVPSNKPLMFFEVALGKPSEQ
ncbi:MAG TPA: hypothetical protein VNE63_07240 [Candidatus Acidoferrales bacterium]|nr:hypothetical protein [Candidatus Acidoferrales bacterium]